MKQGMTQDDWVVVSKMSRCVHDMSMTKGISHELGTNLTLEGSGDSVWVWNFGKNGS